MKLKKILAALLAAVLFTGLAAAPARAGVFPDVTDPETARAADALSALGIIGGDDYGMFRPDDTFTRVHFAKMAVGFMGKTREAEAQMNRTIFTDVPGSHWGRGYVNLAVSTVLDEKTGVRLMMGVGGGRFEPGRDINYQEAVTALLRVLGYSAEADAYWPASAVQTAARLGLDKGLNITQPNAPITRGQAARLFIHALSTVPKGGEKPYAAALGTLVEKVIVLSTNGTWNGQSGWVFTSAGGHYRPAGQVDAGLLGRRGAALLDGEGRFVTLLEDGSDAVTAAVSRVQGNYLYTTDGVNYSLDDATPVYVGSRGEISTWREQLPSILPGDTVTIYLEDGAVTGLFRSATAVTSGFVVVRGAAGPAAFASLTGGDTGYTIRKNGSTVSLGDIEPYDVATYDPVSKVLTVCDTRLSCIYEDAAPSPAAPSVLHAAGGNRFPVMSGAMDELAEFKIGDRLTLLFTAAGQVAGAVSGRSVRGNAVGVVRDGSVKLVGTNITLTAKDAAGKEDQLVSVSGNRGELVLGRVSLNRASGSFDRTAMTLGNQTVSDSVQVYEQGSGGLATVSLSSLPDSIAAGRIRGCHTDSAGRVDLIVIQNVTGDGAVYGRIEPFSRYELRPVRGVGRPIPVYAEDEPEDPEDDDREPIGWVDERGNPVDKDGCRLDEDGDLLTEPEEIPQLKFITPDGEKVYDACDGREIGSCFGSIRVYTEEDGDGAERTYAEVDSKLKAVGGVRSADFYTEGGMTWVTDGKKTYQVADGVLCYNKAASSGRWVWDKIGETDVYDSRPVWFDSLLDARIYSPTVTLYVDGVGGRVRVVSAG